MNRYSTEFSHQNQQDQGYPGGYMQTENLDGDNLEDLSYDASDEIIDKVSKPKSKDDFASMIIAFFEQIHMKSLVGLIIVMLLVFSDIFVDKFLNRVKGTTDGSNIPNSKGTLIQVLIVTILYALINMVVEAEII
jgi:hypothetical protein